MVSVYSLLLLSEACFWNSFGFDRSAAQIYFLAPVPFSRVLIGKNLSALFFIVLEISAITIGVRRSCGMPLTPVPIWWKPIRWRAWSPFFCWAPEICCRSTRRAA